LVRRDASEPTAQLSGALRGERSPHLEETVGKTSFKDRARDGWESRLTTQVDALPDLFLAALEEPERLRFLRAEARAACGAEHFDDPGIGFARRQAFHFQSHRRFPAVDEHFGVQHRVVPGVASGQAALAVGTLRVDLLQLRVNAERLPAE